MVIITSPLSNFFRMDHLLFSLMLLLSSCAKEARTASIISPSPDRVLMFCSSKKIPTPSSFSSLANCRTVTVFLANLDMDFVIIKSISPEKIKVSLKAAKRFQRNLDFILHSESDTINLRVG